jgi:hypothetical protein
VDTNLHIVTTSEHLLKPLRPGERAQGLCVVYSIWGVSSIGQVQPGFHVAYLPVKDIVARDIAHAPTGSKILLRAQHGIWVIGAVSRETRHLYEHWAPLPKLPPELKKSRLE